MDSPAPRRPLTPPPELIAHCSGSHCADAFFRVGEEFLRYFREYAGLRPQDHVLDLGCGCGRMAIPLLSYLDRSARYEGLDVAVRSVAWADEAITPRHPNFRFQVADVFNSTYNPCGAVRPEHYRLPFADGSFDFVFLASVFTHMLPAGQQNYLAEIARVLKLGGRCLATFFLLNDAAEARIRAGRSTFQFAHRNGSCAVQNRDRPEDVVACEQTEVLSRVRACGFELMQPVLPGTWSGQPDAECFQDLLILKKVRQLPVLVRWRRAMARRIQQLEQIVFRGAAQAPAA